MKVLLLIVALTIVAALHVAKWVLTLVPGTINVSDVMSGKCLAKIGSGDDTRHERQRARAMHNITALHFSDERNEVYTGNKAGLVHVWTN
jgi:hypothetical protein